MKYNRRFWEQYIFFGLLISLILTFTVAPFFEERDVATKLLNVFMVTALIFSVIIVSRSKASFIVAFLLSLPMLISNLVFSLQNEQTFSIWQVSTTALFFMYIAVILLKNIFTSIQVDVNLILGAVCVYLLTAVIWALLYALTTALIPGSFEFVGENILSSHVRDFMYYSLVTMTTVGYGDIVPLSAPAKSLATMQALFGQIYIAVIIARLVGLHMQQKS